MGKYHNKLDKKYFNKSVYINKFEKAFNIKIKDYPLQYELVFETFNTFIMINNTLFSLNYIPIDKKVDNMISILEDYLSKYKNKIKKCYDSECILLYESFENILDELNEMKQLHIDKKARYNLKIFENDFEYIMNLLDVVNFDKLIDSKDLVYSKKPNDKLPKKVNLKIMSDIEIHTTTIFDIHRQEILNNNFISNYSKIKYNLNEDKEQQDFIFDTLTRIKDINNAFVDYYIYDKDRTVLDIYNSYLKDYVNNVDINSIKDIEFENVFNRLKQVNKLIELEDMEKAFNVIKELVEQYKDLYERMS